MPPHIIIIGMPFSHMAIMRLQASMNMSLEASSIGIISQTMPFGVILQVILHIIMGIMPIIIGFIIGIMPFIIGIMPMGIMLFIIGIEGICIAGVMIGSVDLVTPAVGGPSMRGA